MAGPSSDGLTYLLDDQPNTFTVTPDFLNSYPKGLFALGGNDYITGSPDSELLYGNQGDDYIIGGGGNDTLIGSKGNDTLQAGPGNSLLNGGKNDDTLIADIGKDTLTGGGGNDLFILPTNAAVTNVANVDIITDFNPLSDAIGLTDSLTENDLTLTSVSLGSSDTLIQIRQSGAILGLVINASPDSLKNHFVNFQRQGSSANSTTAPTFDSRFGYGLVDAANAVAKASNSSPFPEIPDLGGNDWPRDLIKAPEVWAKGFRGDGVVVAVIDSGIDYNHPDLKDNIWSNPGETGMTANGIDKASDGIDNDGNGFVDDFRGWNLVGNNNNPLDDNGHGTHISGLIAAEENDFGITGVAPHAKIMPIKILDKNGVGKITDEIAGIYYAVNSGANVINLSLGGRDPNQNELNAIRYAAEKGVVVIASSGNDSLSSPDYPARFATNYGIAVGSVDRNQKVSYFTNLAGSTPLDYVVAPGGAGGVSQQNNIYSTYSTASVSFPGTLYRSLAGTSMAAPQVAGVVALIRQANPNLSVSEIEQIIVKTANSSGVTV